jgi:hypothetical protein
LVTGGYSNRRMGCFIRQHLRQDGVEMLDSEKCKRCDTLCQAWYGKKFSDLVKKVREKADFKAEFDQAGTNLTKLEKDEEISWPVPESFCTQKFSGSRTEVTYWFLTTVEFHKMFKHQPTSLGLHVVPWHDEHGAKVRGVFLRPSGKKPDVCRRVKYFYETSWKHSEKKMKPKRRLRLRQATEAFSAATDQSIRERPKEPCSCVSVTHGPLSDTSFFARPRIISGPLPVSGLALTKNLTTCFY